MVNNDARITMRQSYTAMPDYDISVPGNHGSDNHMANGSNPDTHRLATLELHHNSPTLEAPARYTAIIKSLLQHCEQDSPQDSAVPHTDKLPSLLRFLRNLSGCGWLRGQFDSITLPPNDHPPLMSKAVHQLPNDQCATCQSNWLPADHFCADLTTQAREMHMEWREVAELVNNLTQRIVDDRYYQANSNVRFAKTGEIMPSITTAASSTLERKASAAEPCETANVVHEEQEILSYEGFTAFSARIYLQLIYYYRAKHLVLEDAQDLTQEAFLVLWNRRHKTRNPKAFLFAVAKHLYYAFLRTRQNGLASLEEAGVIEKPDWSESSWATQETSSSFDNAGLITKIISCMDRLSQNQRKVIQCIYVDGLSQIQTAKKLGMTRRTLRTHLLRATDALKAWR